MKAAGRSMIDRAAASWVKGKAGLVAKASRAVEDVCHLPQKCLGRGGLDCRPKRPVKTPNRGLWSDGRARRKSCRRKKDVSVIGHLKRSQSKVLASPLAVHVGPHAGLNSRPLYFIRI